MAQRKYPDAQPFSLLDTCYDLSSYTTVEVPTMAFHFQGGSDLVLNAANILIAGSGRSQICFAFAGNIKVEDGGCWVVALSPIPFPL
uniref:Xylanase inhibitor C-terminal domain-containing protein n=1 Tax=Nymphaea colorata TaxID=210225 RepID=A0A5K0XXR5_9MAGN